MPWLLSDFIVCSLNTTSIIFLGDFNIHIQNLPSTLTSTGIDFLSSSDYFPQPHLNLTLPKKKHILQCLNVKTPLSHHHFFFFHLPHLVYNSENPLPILGPSNDPHSISCLSFSSFSLYSIYILLYIIRTTFLCMP